MSIFVNEKTGLFQIVTENTEYQMKADKYGVLQEIVKIDEKDGDAKACANNKLSELNKVKESFSIEIIEAVNSYIRAGALITVDDANYLLESTDHSIKNGVHYVKLGLRKF